MIREIIKGLIGFTVLFFCSALALSEFTRAEDYHIEMPLVAQGGGCGG